MFVLQKDRNNHCKSVMKTQLIGVQEMVQAGGSPQFMQILLSRFGAFRGRQDVSVAETSSVPCGQPSGHPRPREWDQEAEIHVPWKA